MSEILELFVDQILAFFPVSTSQLYQGLGGNPLVS